MKKRYIIPLIFFCIVFFLVLALYLLVTQTNFVEAQVARYISGLLDKDIPVQVDIGKIRLFIWGEVVVEDLKVEYVEKGLEYTILNLKRLKLNFNLSDLLKRRWNFNQIGLYDAEVKIRQAEDGRLLIPSLKKSKASSGGGSDFSVSFILLKGGSFDWLGARNSFHLDSINLNLSLNKDKEGINLSLLNGSFFARSGEVLWLKKISGRAKIKSGELSLGKVELQTADSRWEVQKGTVILKPFSFSVDLKAEPFHLAEVKKISNTELEGRLGLEGHLEGNLKRFKGDMLLEGDLFGRELNRLRAEFLFEKRKFTFYSLRGKAFGSEVQLRGELNLGEKPERYLLKGKVESLDLANVVSTNLQSDLSGNIDMKGKGFKEDDFQLNLGLELEPGKFDRYSFSKAIGNIYVRIDEVKLDRDFKLWYKNTELVGEGRIGFDDSLNLKGRAVFKDLNDFEGQTFVKEVKGRGKFQFTASGPLSDFTLEGRLDSDSVWGYQLFSSDLRADLRIDKFISRRGGVIELQLLKGTVWGIPYDSLSSRIFLEGDSISIDTTRLSSNSLSLFLTGNLDISRYPQKLIFDKINLDYRGNSIASSIPARIEIDKDEVRFVQNSFKVNGGDFSVSGKLDFQERMDLNLDFKRLRISPWARLFFPAKRMDGRLDANLKLKGNFEAPELNLYAEIRDINYENVELGFLSGIFSYERRKLFFDKVSLLHPDGDYKLSGFIPIDLSFYPVPNRLLDQTQNIVFKGEGKIFSLIHIFIPEVEYLKGTFKGEVLITGTPLHPLFKGSLDLSEGTLKLVPFRNPITQVQSRLRMENENLFIDEVRGFASHEKVTRDNLLKRIWHFFFPREEIKGEVYLYGNINFENIEKLKYDLNLIARNLPLSYEYADLVGTTDLNIEISGLSPPLVSGEIFLSHLAFRDPFNSLIQVKAGPPSPTENQWDLNLSLSGDNNLWVLNQDIQTEFKGEILLSRKSGDLKLLGNLETLRGKYFLYGTTFKIEKGNFIFDDIQKIDPKLDFLVSTSLNGSGYSSKDSIKQKEQEIELAITGTLSAPEMQPAPNSPYSKEEIAELLAFHQRFSTTESGRGSLFQYRLAGSLGEAYANRFLENLATRSIGVETFEIRPLEPGKFSLWESEVTVGKYISDKVYFRYTRRLSESTGQEAGLEYRLSKRIYLEGYRDKKGLFHLGLNLYWEY